jgi:spore coat polysaccharide biosynthesis predicted glycosyltransferase SpsG
MTPLSLVVRADATPEIGAGHLMRCISLADGWTAEGLGDAFVWGEVSIPFAKKRLEQRGIALLESAPSDPISVLLVDSYDPGIRRSTPIAVRSRLRVLVDDVGDSTEGYDVIWNPNPYSADGLYSGFAGPVISGEATVPIRAGLPQWSRQSSAIAVTLGGTRPADWLVEALRIWSRSLEEPPVAGRSPWTPSDWTAVPAEETWAAFARCSTLVSSAGSTVWEAANVGIPLCLIVTADNQRLAAQWAAHHGIPQLDALCEREPAAFAASVGDAVAAASRLPNLKSGARSAARTIGKLLAEQGHQ